MHRCATGVSVLRVEPVRRLLHSPPAHAYHRLSLRQPLQPPRRPPRHSGPSTLCLLRPPSLISVDVTRKCSFEVSEVRYEQVSDETLESLSEYLEELVASETGLQDSDVLYSSGVLTLQLGTHGTYVINKQTPNRQIWLSSPVSGPKRFDFLDGLWIYRHTGETLHGLLNSELARVFSPNLDFCSCAYGSREAA